MAGCDWLQPGRNILATWHQLFCSTLYALWPALVGALVPHWYAEYSDLTSTKHSPQYGPPCSILAKFSIRNITQPCVGPAVSRARIVARPDGAVGGARVPVGGGGAGSQRATARSCSRPRGQRRRRRLIGHLPVFSSSPSRRTLRITFRRPPYMMSRIGGRSQRSGRGKRLRELCSRNKFQMRTRGRGSKNPEIL